MRNTAEQQRVHPWPAMRGNTHNTGALLTTYDSITLTPPASYIATQGAIFSTPVIDRNEIIYVGSSDRNFYAYDTKIKKILWQLATREVIDSAAALHTNGRIYVPSGDGNIYCINEKGEKLWTFNVASHRESNQYSFATSYWWEGNIAISPEGNIFAGNDDFFLYCISPEGKLLWKYRTGLFIWSLAVFAQPDMVIASSFDGVVYALNRTTGKLIWKRDVKNPLISSPVVHKGLLFQCTLGGTLVALALRTGKLQWSQKIPPHVYASPAVTPDGRIITASSSGDIMAFDIGTHQLAWVTKEFSVIRSSPVIGPDPEHIAPYLIYGGNADGELFALDPQGTLRWRFHTAASTHAKQHLAINASLALGNHGIAAAAGKYICYLPYNHYLQPLPAFTITPQERSVPKIATREHNAFILDTINIITPTIIPTLDQIGLQSLKISIGILHRNIQDNTFLAHGTLVFGRDAEGALVGVPHSQTYSFGFQGIQQGDTVTMTAHNIFLETSGFPFPLDTFEIRTSETQLDSNATIHIHVIKKGAVRTALSIIRAYNAIHPSKQIIKNIHHIQDIPYIAYAALRIVLVATTFLMRRYWKTWDLFDAEGSIHGNGTASLRLPTEDERHTPVWKVITCSYNKFSRKITVQLTSEHTVRTHQIEELSIVVVQAGSTLPLPINYSLGVKKILLSPTRAKIALRIPSKFLNNSEQLTAYINESTSLLATHDI